MISFGADAPKALTRLTEVLEHLSCFGLQLTAKKCILMQMEVALLGHIVGRAGLACHPVKLSAVRAWHAPGSVKQECQFVGFIQHFAELSEPLVALTRKGSVFTWTSRETGVI